SACPQLHVIISSREILRVAGEHALRVAPLGLESMGDDSSPDDLRENPSVRLFVERAQATNPDYALTPESFKNIAKICELLEGMPLAIELAAARARIFTSEELLARLQKNFKALSRKSRSLPARQTTIEGAIQWSYDLLEDEEKILFRRLSIFVGGWSLESCEQICSHGLEEDVFELLETLIDKSIIYESVDPTGLPRFRFLETVRVFALELFDGLPDEEQDALIEPYIEYFTELAGEPFPRAAAPVIVPKLEKEYGNIRKTFELAGLRNLPGHRLRISSNLWNYWYVKGGLQEGIDWLTQSIEENPDATELLLGQAHLGLSTLLRTTGHEEEFAWHLDTAYELFKSSNDDVGQARCLNSYAHIEISAGNHQKVIEIFNQALVKAKGIDDEIYALISSNLGSVYLEQERYAEAQSILEESLNLGIKIGSSPEIYYAQYLLAEVAYKLERYASAREHTYSALLHVLKITTLWGAGVCLAMLGRIEIKQEHYARGIVLCAAAAQFRKTIELKLDEEEQKELDALLAIANEKVGEEQSADLVRQGAKMSFEDALRYALEDFGK
ncbi:MAG: tetratricopeptide repeat protein, partial [Chloroflexi bacterium]|nr:tetratricopeptide repeat protein [Chloroflexota bacterium]